MRNIPLGTWVLGEGMRGQTLERVRPTLEEVEVAIKRKKGCHGIEGEQIEHIDTHTHTSSCSSDNSLLSLE